jgi:hypothetical protein
MGYWIMRFIHWLSSQFKLIIFIKIMLSFFIKKIGVGIIGFRPGLIDSIKSLITYKILVTN